MTQQVDDFIKTGGRLGDVDLIVVWAGSNDIFGAKRQDRADLDRRIAKTSANMEKSLTQLHKLGGRHFIVATRSPREVIGSENDLNGVDMNAAIVMMARQVRDNLGTDIKIYDAYSAISDMVKNPSRYGFVEITSLCVAVPTCAAQNFDVGLSVADTYINWDSAHKTTRVHKLMAEQIQSMLTN